MPDPQVRYCTTEDGVRIAYCEAGEGTPFIEVLGLSNIELEFRDWEWHRIMAARRRLIRFDCRGSGLSQRDVADFSVEAMALDIGAVADALGLQTFVLYGETWPVPTPVPAVISYAVQHPERVSHLIVLGGCARAAEFYEIPRVKTLFAMLDQGDWELFTDTLVLVQVGWELAEMAHGAGEVWRASQTLEQAQAFFRAARRHDVADLLPQVRVPTLVLHPRGAQFPTLEMAQKLAASIPGARLKVLESATFWSNEMEPQFLDALDEFIGDGGRPTAADVLPHVQRIAQKPAGLVTVLFTDLVGHTEMMQRLGDEQGRAVLREHERITREALSAHAGVEVKTMGDGFMASFGSVTKALECAVALQRAFADHSESSPEPLDVRVGLNAGEPIEEEGDLFGSTVILASRIAAQAGPGEILVPDTVRGLASGKGFLFADRGEVIPKGFEEPVRLYEVRWRDE